MIDFSVTGIVRQPGLAPQLLDATSAFILFDIFTDLYAFLHIDDRLLSDRNCPATWAGPRRDWVVWIVTISSLRSGIGSKGSGSSKSKNSEQFHGAVLIF